MNFKKISIGIIICLIILSGITIVSASDLSDLIGSKDALSIDKACFATGDGLSEKTYASFYVGECFANENIKIQIYYSRDGVDLNNGNIVPKVITDDGYIDVASADAYTSYPDCAEIYVYDNENNLLDTKTVSLSPSYEKQAFDLEIYEDGLRPANPTKDIEKHFDEYIKNQ